MLELEQSAFQIETGKPGTECGVYALYLDPSLANNRIVQMALESANDNQHRGEESAGVCVSDGCSQWPPIKRMGLIGQLNQDYKTQIAVHGGLYGHIAIVHNRYSTTGSSTIANAAPFYFETELGTFAIAHNGNITNAAELKAVLISQGFTFSSTTDSEVIGALIAKSAGYSWKEKTDNALKQLEGAFCLVISTKDEVLAARDGFGFHPLSIAEFVIDGKKCFAVSSETAGFSKLPVENVRDIAPGELIEIKDGKAESTQFIENPEEAFCGLNFAYLMRPDSRFEGIQQDTIRRHFGKMLATYYPVPYSTDLVTYIPESARPAAEGYAKQLSMMQQRYVQSITSMIKGRYGTLNGAQRGFINPEREERKKVAKSNYYPFDEIIDKEVALVDDSIFEATTTGGVLATVTKSVGVLKNSGVSKVHVRIVFPQAISSCPYGVDIDERRFLVAKEMNQNLDAIADYIGADSLAYLTLPEFSSSINESVGRQVGLCMGCTTGQYPTKWRGADKLILESEIH